MIARVYKPGPPLGAFVDCLWRFQGYTPVHKRERASPTGTVEMVVSLRDETFRVFGKGGDTQGQPFCGAQSEYFVLDTSQASEPRQSWSGAWAWIQSPPQNAP